MKKTMKMMLALMAGALTFSACSNEDDVVATGENNGAKLVTLTAYQEGAGSTTRAAIAGTEGDAAKTINWTSGDALMVYTEDGATSGEFTTTTGGSTSAEFTSSTFTGTPKYAIYPASAAKSISSGVITAEVPMTQTATAGTFDPDAALMVGTITDGNIQFMNVMSYIKVTVPECKQVSVKAKDAWTTVSGKVTINATDAIWSETSSKEGQAFVRLVPETDGGTIAAGTYYIAVLPGSMSTGLEVYYNINGTDVYCKQGSSAIASERNKVQSIGTLVASIEGTGKATYKVGNLGSTKFANCNIGAKPGASGTAAYGDYFAFGALRPAYKTHTAGSYLTNDNLYQSGGFTAAPSTFQDIAAMLWGGKWRMPTKDELSDNTSTLQSLSLAGCYLGSGLFRAGRRGYYWSATAYVSYYAYYLGTNGNDAHVYYNFREIGMTVRPVLAQ